MKIKSDVEEVKKSYKVGDIIYWENSFYTIIKNPANGLYSLLLDDCDCFANGMFQNMDSLMEDWGRFTKGTFKHYPKSEYELRIVKKEGNK